MDHPRRCHAPPPARANSDDHYVGSTPPDADIYRRDLTVSPRALESQLAWLRGQGFTAIALDDIYAAFKQGAPLPPKPIILTFDDGYADAYTHAFPLLRRYGMTGTFFVVTKSSTPPSRATSPGTRSGRWRRRAWPSSHLRSHPDLPTAATTTARYRLSAAPRPSKPDRRAPALLLLSERALRRRRAGRAARSGHRAAVATQPGTLHTSDAPLGCHGRASQHDDARRPGVDGLPEDGIGKSFTAEDARSQEERDILQLFSLFPSVALCGPLFCFSLTADRCSLKKQPGGAVGGAPARGRGWKRVVPP